jgi:hypothetical protein
MRILSITTFGLLLIAACSSSGGGSSTNNEPGGGSGEHASSGNGGGSSSGGSNTAGSGNSMGSSGAGGSTGSGGSSGTGGSSGDQGSSGTSTTEPSDGGPSTAADAPQFTTDASVAACGTTKLLEVPDDPSARGPWDVGVRTATVGRLTVEVFYPAQPGTTTGVAEVTYNQVDWLPTDQQTKVPTANQSLLAPLGGHLFRGVPIDPNYGPYPVVIAIHGTASMRVASLSAYAQWASRGFVVASADYPGLYLTDKLCATADCKTKSKSCATVGTQDVPTDVKTQITALTTPSGDLAFLAGHADMSRIGITGHSQGACISAGLSTDANVEIVMPMAGANNVIASSTLKSVIFIAGINDTVIGYNSVKFGNTVCTAGAGQTDTSDTGAYNASPGAPVVKRLVGITGGGHLVVTDLCQLNAAKRNGIQEALNDQVCGISTAVSGISLATLFDCGTIAVDDGIKAVNYASTAAFEETLHCDDRSKQFANMKTAVPVIGDFQHSP